MHELGIANSVLDAVRAEAALRPAARVCKIGLRIGELAGIDGASLSFCFGVLTRDTELACAALAIEATPGDELDLAYLEMEE